MNHITNQLLSIIPIQLDYFSSNSYISGNTIIVETISEYLIRIVKPIRKYDQLVSILEPAGQYNINDFINTKNFFTASNYKFINGLDDEDFILVTNSLNGIDIVNLLSALPFEDKLQSNQITYNDRTIKETLDEMLYITSGDIIIRVSDNGIRQNIKYNILSGNTISRSGYTTTSDIIITVPSGSYRIQLFPVAGYDIFNISIITDNNINNNLNSTSTIIDNVDIGFLRTEVNAILKPHDLPILNNFLINSGATESANPNLSILLDTVGIVSDYIVSQNSNFSSGSWLPYTGSINYTFNYISQISLTLYVKVRNSLGESSSYSQSILMKNGISRSDTLKTYNSIADAVNDVILDYGTGLTQNVIIEVNNDVYHTTKGRATNNIFYLTIDDFNFDGEFSLTIKGNNKLTIDCHSLGGIKTNHCSNIIFDGIKFINVANYMYDYAPESTPAIFSQGTSDRICKNIVITNCTINGSVVWTDGVKHYGDYGLIFKYIETVTVLNTDIQGFQAFIFDVSNLTAISLSNINFHDNYVIYDVISQPCYLNVGTVELVYIEDCIFDLSNYETGVITNNVIRLITTRCKYFNAKGEVFRLQNTVDMELLEINACSISNNLLNPVYQWIKQVISFSTIKIINLSNNTIVLTAVGSFQMYSFLFRGTQIGRLYSYNNIFDFNFPNMVNNRDEAVLFNTATLDYWESDYNLYRDYTTDYNTLTNMILSCSDITSTVYFKRMLLLSGYRTLGYDLNSTLYNTIDTIFVNNDISKLSISANNLPVSTGFTTKFDINKNITNVYNIGAYFQISTSPTIDNVYSYRAIDTFKLSEFTSGLEYNTYSKNLLELIPISNEKGIYFKWIIEDELSDIITYYTLCLPIHLYSKLDNNGVYTDNMVYSIEIIKN